MPGWATLPDTEFRGQEQNPFVAGEFVWTGFDYLGEPTPYNADTSNLLNFSDPAEKAKMQQELQALGKIKVPSRSSYFGIVDLAGFKKDRFYLYQSHWRPELPMAHILPHWNWPDRVGQVTPVCVYTSGDSAELFLNGKSLGLKKKDQYEYRLRWDDVVYQPGEVESRRLQERKEMGDGHRQNHRRAGQIAVVGRPQQNCGRWQGLVVHHRHGCGSGRFAGTTLEKPPALQPWTGPGEIVATDNGDATSFESFQAPERNAYNGLALVIVRAKPGQSGTIKLTASSAGLASATLTVRGVAGLN